jgi:hypothetical protein
VPGETELANDAFGLIGVVVSAVSADVRVQAQLAGSLDATLTKARKVMV